MAQAPANAPATVRLKVVALDAKGQPVADLAPADLETLDQGKPQRLLYFHHRSTPAAAKPADELSNHAPTPHTTAILIDFMNQPRGDALEAVKKVGQSLQQLESGESLYLYFLGMDGVMTPLHAFPANSLIPQADDKTWTKDAEAQLTKAGKSLSRARPGGMLVEERVKKTYVALETLAKQLTAFSGDRNIVWVMKDVPTISNPQTTCSGDWLDCGLYVPHLTVTMQHAGVSVNPVTYATIDDPNTNRGMVDFAGLLAGRPFFGDDIRRVLTTLNGVDAGVYDVAYEPPAESMDNKFHRLKVASEKKGIKFEARQRYYAYTDARPPAARVQEALLNAIKSPWDDTTIGIRANASPSGAGLKIEARIEPADLLIREEGGAFTAHVTMLLVGYAAGGPTGSPVPADLSVRLTKEQFETAKKEGLPFSQDFPTDPQIQRVRFFVYDQGTGATGSLFIPVKR
jgi:VWFA-related protein